MNNELILSISVVAVIVATTVFLVVRYLRDKSLEDVRVDAYKFFLEAKHTYLEGSGAEKMQWVLGQVRSLLPNWVQFFVTEELLMRVVQAWFDEVEDLLDDGKLNNSTEGE